MQPGRSYSFVFVCQAGELELKAVLLAASLRRHVKCRHELVAAIPGPAELWGEISPVTAHLLERLGVRTVGIENPVDPAFKHANKIACLSVPTTADKRYYLDTDILCLRDFHDEPRFSRPLHCKPADWQTFGVEESAWREVYATVGVDMPNVRMPTTATQQPGPPYFNGGVVVLDRELPLGQRWAAFAGAIRANTRISDRRLWSDQISLAAAVASLGDDYDCLDESYNYPAHIRPIDPVRPPRFVHYHWPEVVRQEPLLRSAVLRYAEELPDLAELFDAYPDWRNLLQRPHHSRTAVAGAAPAPQVTAISGGTRQPQRAGPAGPPTVVLAGVPRSGAGLLCQLIGSHRNCVALNEPEQAIKPLAESGAPWELARFLRYVRANVVDGLPIESMPTDGPGAMGPTAAGARASGQATVDHADFVLAIKHNRAFLPNFTRIRRVLPHARIAVCIRNPFDTIASWIRSAASAEPAEDALQRASCAENPCWTEPQRERLLWIAARTDPRERRAWQWQFWGQWVLSLSADVVLVRHEDLLDDPRAAVARLLRGFDVGAERHPWLPLRPGDSAKLDRAELDIIQRICGETAAELGLRCVPDVASSTAASRSTSAS